MTASELGRLVAERQFRGDESRVKVSLTPTLPLITLRRGQIITIDPAGVPEAELISAGYLATVEVTARRWRVEGYSCSVELDGTGTAKIQAGTIQCEEIVP